MGDPAGNHVGGPPVERSGLLREVIDPGRHHRLDGRRKEVTVRGPEGVRTARAVRLLADRHGIEMPITERVHAVLYEGQSVRAAVEELMARPLKGEYE